ncbi:MAG TPA: hypothetical protein VLA89_06000, partial [Gemmatimonadales bacterium]|nr:hypothetical protein [Gemmatimonadales bacterium]
MPIIGADGNQERDQHSGAGAPGTRGQAPGRTPNPNPPSTSTGDSSNKDLALKRSYDQPSSTQPSFQNWAIRRGYNPWDDKPPAEKKLWSENPYAFDDEMAWKSRISRWQTVEGRLDEIEKITGSKLPTDLSLAMAEGIVDKFELNRAARLFARELNTPFSNLFQPVTVGNKSIWINPETNKPLTLSAARRLYKPYETRFYRGILRDQKVDPTDAAAWFRALSPVAGDGVAWQDAMGAAIGMAEKMPTTAIDPFRQNLKMFAADTELKDPVSGQMVDEMGKVSLAFEAARQGITLHDGTEVMAFLWGGPGPEPAVGTAEHAQWDNRRKLWEKWNGASEHADNLMAAARGETSGPVTVWDTGETQQDVSRTVWNELPVVFQDGEYTLTEKAAQLPEDVRLALDIKISGKNAPEEGYQAMIERIKNDYMADEDA